MGILYTIVRALHSLNRWVVLVLAIWALVVVVRGWAGKREWRPADAQPGRWFAIAASIQLVLGLLFYVLPGSTPWAAYANMANAMRDPNIRYFLVEHSVLMIAAVAFAHAGTGAFKRAIPALAKYRRATIFYALSLIVMLIAIPWPFSRVPRGWLPF